jgi:hypothetical protein
VKTMKTTKTTKTKGRALKSSCSSVIAGQCSFAWPGPLLFHCWKVRAAPREETVQPVYSNTLYLLIRLATVFTNVCVDERVARQTVLTTKQTLPAPICTVPASPRTPQRNIDPARDNFTNNAI